jgi:hypothetical protein
MPCIYFAIQLNDETTALFYIR